MVNEEDPLLLLHQLPQEVNGEERLTNFLVFHNYYLVDVRWFDT
jgi:hypothetical protein